MKSLMGIAFALLAAVALPAQAIMIVGGSFDGTNVGGLDEIEAEGPKVNGEQAELDFINDATGESFTDLTKTETVAWYNTDVTNVIAFQLVTGPGYYLVKNAQSIVLLLNNASVNWGVLDLDLLTVDLNLGSDMLISHVSEAGTAVPEPATLSLLGAGLLALAFGRRRRSLR